MMTSRQTRDEFATKREQAFPNPQRLIDRGKPAINFYREITMPAGKVWLIQPAPSDPKGAVWAGYKDTGHMPHDLHFRVESRAAFDELAVQQGWLIEDERGKLVEGKGVEVVYITDLVLDPGVPGDNPEDPPKVAPITAGFHANVRLGR